MLVLKLKLQTANWVAVEDSSNSIVPYELKSKAVDKRNLYKYGPASPGMFINAEKYTLTDIKYLGYCELILGCIFLKIQSQVVILHILTQLFQLRYYQS